MTLIVSRKGTINLVRSCLSDMIGISIILYLRLMVQSLAVLTPLSSRSSLYLRTEDGSTTIQVHISSLSLALPLVVKV